jgi:hypothetical protein
VSNTRLNCESCVSSKAVLKAFKEGYKLCFRLIKIIMTIFQVFMNHMQDVDLLLAGTQNLDYDRMSGVYE